VPQLSGEINRQWLIAKAPDGSVGDQNFRWNETGIPLPGEGQALVRNLWFSFDPTNALIIDSPPDSGGVPAGGVMRGLAVSQVLRSRHPRFRPGDLLHGYSGWEDYSLTDGRGFVDTTVVPEGVAPALALGVLGVTGMAAYFGVMDVGQPQKGETFVVSGAAGGVGSVAGQIARIRGARVIGIAGGEAKRRWLLDEGGFAGAIDHRTENVAARLDELCPDGIDVYFDNVAGPMLDLAVARLRNRGRIVLCGVTSWYLLNEPPSSPPPYVTLIMKNGRMEGLLAKDYFDRFPEAVRVLQGWLDSGDLRSKEDIVVGLENAPKGLARLFLGDNVGKQLLKVADPLTPKELAEWARRFPPTPERAS
jgi:NADPH-dependent curcumin reductase